MPLSTLKPSADGSRGAPTPRGPERCSLCAEPQRRPAAGSGPEALTAVPPPCPRWWQPLTAGVEGDQLHPWASARHSQGQNGVEQQSHAQCLWDPWAQRPGSKSLYGPEAQFSSSLPNLSELPKVSADTASFRPPSYLHTQISSGRSLMHIPALLLPVVRLQASYFTSVASVCLSIKWRIIVVPAWPGCEE